MSLAISDQEEIDISAIFLILPTDMCCAVVKGLKIVLHVWACDVEGGVGLGKGCGW